MYLVKFLLLSLIAVGQNNLITSQRAPNTLIAQARENYFCPNGFQYDKIYRLCISNQEAVGPFTNKMIAQCKDFGGGSRTCEGTRWEVNFARNLREKTICPPGARFDFEISQCIEGKNVYGPFTESIVTQCQASEGEAVCETMRYSRELFPKAFHFPEPTEAARSQTYTLWSTFYFAYPAVSIANGIPLLGISGNSLGTKLFQRDWCLGAIEGTIEVTDQAGAKTTYNFAGTGSAQQVNCRPVTNSQFPGGKERYKISKGPYGEGVLAMNLVPFRTIAVDRSVIPIGSVIFIPSARGKTITLPSGETVKHDGYFYAADVGSGIQNNHIDVFTGISLTNPFSFVTSDPNGTFRTFLIKDPQIEGALKAMHQLNF